MPCQAALSIAKGQVADERMRALITPEVAEMVFTQWLKAQGVTGRVVRSNVGAYVWIAGMAFSIDDGVVTVQHSDPSYARKVRDQVVAEMNVAADAMLSQQLAAALRKLGRTTMRQLPVESDGQQLMATVFETKVSF